MRSWASLRQLRLQMKPRKAPGMLGLLLGLDADFGVGFAPEGPGSGRCWPPALWRCLCRGAASGDLGSASKPACPLISNSSEVPDYKIARRHRGRKARFATAAFQVSLSSRLSADLPRGSTRPSGHHVDKRGSTRQNRPGNQHFAYFASCIAGAGRRGPVFVRA